jgi:H+/Cl- antiporter ClcA
MRTGRWWRLAGIGVFFGLLGSLLALAFLGIESALLDVVWPDDISPEAFSGSPRILVIMAAAGLIVGLIRRFVQKAEEANVFKALTEGRIDPGTLVGGLSVSMVSLVGGFSLGPEVPTGMISGGTATYVAERQGLDDESRRVGVLSAISGAWGGLFTSPYIMSAIVLEVGRMGRGVNWPVAIIQIGAAFIGFAIFFVVGGFAATVNLLDLPVYDFEAWHLVIAILLGALSAAVAVFFVMSLRFFTALGKRFSDDVILSSLLAGVALGLLAMALPLTLFLGTEGLVEVTEMGVALGAGLLIASALAKVVATTAALGFGFIGGPIFPLMFVGGSIGMAVHVLIPELPAGLTVPAMTAAVPSGVLPIPLALSILTVVVALTSITDAAPVLAAAVTSFLLVRGAVMNHAH